jgi:hypothetical protein
LRAWRPFAALLAPRPLLTFDARLTDCACFAWRARLTLRAWRTNRPLFAFAAICSISSVFAALTLQTRRAWWSLITRWPSRSLESTLPRRPLRTNTTINAVFNRSNSRVNAFQHFRSQISDLCAQLGNDSLRLRLDQRALALPRSSFGLKRPT